MLEEVSERKKKENEAKSWVKAHLRKVECKRQKIEVNLALI